MATTTLIQRPTLVARWVMVTDLTGRKRAVMRWAPVDDAQPAHVRAA
jgi:hypothetical protein